MRRFHADGSVPPITVWVFGSNLAGWHGRGAALVAQRSFRAKSGVGVGRQGNAYAIPTKNENLHTLPVDVIQQHVEDFLAYARQHPEIEFFVTAVGCGLAGLRHEVMAPMFSAAGDNCTFPDTWRPYLAGAG